MIDQGALLELVARLNGRRVVASISGGKDSAAMSLYLRELGIEHDRVFMDTGWEHSITYAYLRGDLTRELGPIERGMVTELPVDDPHSPTKGCRRCKGKGHLSQIVFGPRGMSLQLEPCPNCKGAGPR